MAVAAGLLEVVAFATAAALAAAAAALAVVILPLVAAATAVRRLSARVIMTLTTPFHRQLRCC